jgi:parallel beta-helix repeat protein
LKRGLTGELAELGIKVGLFFFVVAVLFVLVSNLRFPSLKIVGSVTQAEWITVPDYYVTIQEAINNAVDGDTVFVKAGTYYEHVVVNKTISLVGEDVDTTIIDGNNTGHVINVITDNVSISGFTVRNSGNVHWPDLDAGICLNGTTGCVISENRVVDNGFAGISLLSSQYNKIAGNNVSGTGWGGIHLMNSSRNTVFDNILDSNGQQLQWGGGINGHAGSHYNNITDNTILNCVCGMFYHDARYNSICRNNISAISVIGIWLQDTVSHNVVAENSLINCTVGIFLEGPNTNNTLSGNFITESEYGIKILNAQSNRVVNNTIADNRAGSDSWRAGIRLEGSGYSQINFNLISGNYYGILLYSYSPRVSVYGNNITGNEFGLRVASGGSSFLTATGNLVADNHGYGIGVTGFGSSSNYATISRNTITNNSDGIALGQYSNYNTISRNNISMNDYGFYIEFSTQNSIYSNNVLNNAQQIFVASGSVNMWDDGYPVGGNFWSDYVGSDVDRDGVGDAPYNIASQNLDHCPLMMALTPHDVAVIKVTPSKLIVNQGSVLCVNTTVINRGSYPETFSLAFRGNGTVLATIDGVNLASWNWTVLSCFWNTTGFANGTYVIEVVASNVLGEIYTADNTFIDGTVKVVKTDLNGDGEVNLLDLIIVANALGSTPGQPTWNTDADVKHDGRINVLDLITVAQTF